MEYFQTSPKAEVVLIGSNKTDAFVLERAKKFDVPTFTFTQSELNAGTVAERLLAEGVDLVVLAGFLLLIPDNLIKAYPDKIVNIHPALLPNYGGKGMYGSRVHEAVKNAGEKETGITIHLVNSEYDKGKIIFQAAVAIHPEDNPETIAQKVHNLEHKYFPNVIESLL